MSAEIPGIMEGFTQMLSGAIKTCEGREARIGGL